MPEFEGNGILSDVHKRRVIDEEETEDARAIREFREAQASYGHRVVLPTKWHFH